MMSEVYHISAISFSDIYKKVKLSFCDTALCFGARIGLFVAINLFLLAYGDLIQY